MAFHVFVEGPTDATPAGVERLASAIAQHYGLPAADLVARLHKGRFRVKGNTDRETAEKYCRDLQILGARCTIEEATAQNSQRATPLPFPAVRPATPVAGTAVLPPRTTAPPAVAPLLPPRAATPPAGSPALPPRAATPPAGSPALPPRAATPPAGSPALPPRAATPPAGTPTPPGGYQSGLAAAFSTEAPAASLGALEGDGLSFSLSSVDGADDRRQANAGNDLSASIGPAPEKPTPVAKADKPKDVPLDLFAPPDAEDAKLQVDLAIDDAPKARTSSPVVEEPARGSAERKSQPSLRGSQPAIEAVAPAQQSKLGPLGDPRARFAIGVLLAIVLGFVPAHLIASARESSAYKAIDNKVLAAQQMADTPDAYATLDRMRTDQLELKKAAQRNTAIIAFAIWALVGAGIAFVWFKKVPWDRLA